MNLSFDIIRLMFIVSLNCSVLMFTVVWLCCLFALFALFVGYVGWLIWFELVIYLVMITVCLYDFMF